MIRQLLIVPSLFVWFALSSIAAEPQQCGGVAGVTCEAPSFCDYPVSTCGVADVQGVCRERPEICTKEYEPVVGCDDRVYSNACMAAAAGVSVKHPYVEPVEWTGGSDTTSDNVDAASRAGMNVAYQGKVRSQGTVERRVGRWSIERIRNDGSDSTTLLSVRFPRPVRNAVILATPYCTFSDHGPATVGYGFSDDRTVDFVFEWPCGFQDFAGLDFVVIR
jgi:hypothetical protein